MDNLKNIFCSLFVFCAILPAQDFKYELVVLEDFPNGYAHSSLSISDQGHIAGKAIVNEEIRPFIWKNGAIEIIPLPPFSPNFDRVSSVAEGINNLGHVVGIVSLNNSTTFEARSFSFFYNGTSSTEIPALFGTGTYQDAKAINDSGYVTGSAKPDPTFASGYFYKNSGIKDIGNLGYSSTRGFAINNLGQIAGQSNLSESEGHAFLYDEINGMTDLGTLGGPFSNANGVNDSTWVVGQSTKADFSRTSFIWKISTGMIELEKLLENENTEAHAINNSGTIVGESGAKAVIWKDGKIEDLNTIVDAPDWLLYKAYDINNNGQIAGWGIIDGQNRAILLNPIVQSEGIVVNTTGDESDADLEDGICDTDLNMAGEQCSFRAAIEQANFNEGADVITFNIPNGGIPKILPKSALPEITTQIKIDATTQPDAGMVEIDGTGAGSAANGLIISANNCEIKGLIITNFAQDGIKITGNFNTITGNIIGTDKNSTTGLGNGQNGISILNAASNTIGEPEVEKLNIIVGNDKNGILISGSSAMGNQVKSNYIGSDTSGTDNLGNGANGILIDDGANNNIIGIDSDVTQPQGAVSSFGKNAAINLGKIGNVIINNLSSIKINNSNANTLFGNLHGIHRRPFSNISLKLKTRLYGLLIKNSFNNRISKSVIGGTASDGIHISGSLSKINKVFKNIIGTDALGTPGLGVLGNGICIDSNAIGNQIGGIGEDSTMTIVSSKKYGIQYRDISKNLSNLFNRTYNTKMGIFKNIPLNKNSRLQVINIKLPNILGGICVLNAQNTIIGKPSAFNTIAGNGGHGITFKGFLTKFNSVASNIIGTTKDGEEDIGNEGDGICIMDSANNNTMGGIFSKFANTIAGNKLNGIGILGSSNNKILSNKIGYMHLLNGQTLPLGNFGHGIFLNNSFQNIIRLSRIAANKKDGIHINGALSKLNKIFGVTVGTDSARTLGLGNLGNGISLMNMLAKNSIGGRGNDSTVTVVSSRKYGIFTRGLLSGSFNKIHNALIGIGLSPNSKSSTNNAKGIQIKMPNILGGLCLENTQNMQIGNPFAPNIIAGNNGPGLILKGLSSKFNKVFSNFFGTDSLGTEGLGNLGANIKLFNGANNNWIGDENEKNGNTIVSSKSHGIYLLNTSANKIFNNNVGLFKRPFLPLKKMGNLNGLFANNAKSTFIKKSLFSGNQKDGMRITGSGSKLFKIFANAFGTDFTGRGILGNGGNGICIDGGANNITLGSDQPSEKNYVNNNKGFGALFKNVFNISLKNFNIGADEDGWLTPVYSNGRGAVKAEDADYSNIGIKLTEMKNILAGYDSIAVKVLNSFHSSIENNNITTSHIGIEAVLDRVQESTLNIKRNYIEKCSRAISVENGTQSYIAGNIISDNIGIGSGIHMFNSKGLITGNILKNDAGDAIYLEDNSNPVITKNNIYGNAGLGLRNESPSVQINAQDNWWGDASGPGGQGPGSGNGVSANIDFQNWKMEEASLIILGKQDTTFQLAGITDTLSSAVLNWANPSDVVDINLSDTRGWLSGPKSFSITLSDSLGKSISIPISIPANSGAGLVNTITINGQSQLNASHTDQTKIYVSTYLPQLTTLVLSPDFASLTLGDTLQFSANGYDQANNKFSFSAEWSADIGSIDTNGLYTANEIDSAAIVTVIDPVSQLSATAKLQINYVTGLDGKNSQNPHNYRLEQNFPNPFNPATTIKYSLPKQSHVSLKIYNILGREVKKLVNKTQNAGIYSIRFDASKLASGLYIYRLQAGKFTQIKKMLMVK